MGERHDTQLLRYEAAYGARDERLLYWGMRLHKGERHETSLMGYDAAYGARDERLLYWGSDCIW